MGGCHLEHAGAELKVDMLVGDDRDELFLPRQLDGQRTNNVFADEVRVARVLGIHGHSRVAGNGFRSGSGDGEPGAGIFRHLDLEVIHEPFLRFHFHFLVGQGGLRHGAPVHHAFAAVDQALLVELHKDLLNTVRILRVHGEPFAGPITGTTQLLELVDDDAAMFLLPFPDPFEEFLAPEVVLRLAFLLFERLLDLHLCGNAGVVRARQPKDFPAVHARLATQDVLDGVVEYVPHMEHARDVGRRDDDGVGRALVADARRVGGEATILHPEVIPLFFDRLRFVGF